MAAAAATVDMRSDGDDAGAGDSLDGDRGHGHFFSKKTFHRPTYCHHCTDMLWGLIGQGYLCEGRYTPPVTPSGRFVDRPVPRDH